MRRLRALTWICYFLLQVGLAGLLHRSCNRSLVSRSCPPSSVLCVFLLDDSPAGASERSTHTKAVRKGEGRPQEAFFSVVRGCDAAAVVQLGEEGALT